MTDKKKPHLAGTGTASKTTFDNLRLFPPIVIGQSAEVLRLIHQFQLVRSLMLTAEHAIPEAAERGRYLRAMGFNIVATILPEVAFRGVIRCNAALYSLGEPDWLHPGFIKEGSGDAG